MTRSRDLLLLWLNRNRRDWHYNWSLKWLKGDSNTMFFYRIRLPQGTSQKRQTMFFHRIRPRRGHHKNDKPCFFTELTPAGDITKTTNHVLLQNSPPQETSQKRQTMFFTESENAILGKYLCNRYFWYSQIFSHLDGRANAYINVSRLGLGAELWKILARKNTKLLKSGTHSGRGMVSIGFWRSLFD